MHGRRLLGSLREREGSKQKNQDSHAVLIVMPPARSKRTRPRRRLAGRMNARQVRILIGLLAAGLTATELYALANAQDGDTITEILRGLHKRYGAIVPFAFGLAMGHVWWGE